MAKQRKSKTPEPPKDPTVQISLTRTLKDRWESSSTRNGYKALQDYIKIAMERQMADDDARLAQ
jgi:hypothetical protein